MDVVTLGQAGPGVSRAGLGLMGMGHSELLLAEALRRVRLDEVFIQAKFGVQPVSAGQAVAVTALPGGPGRLRPPAVDCGRTGRSGRSHPAPSTRRRPGPCRTPAR